MNTRSVQKLLNDVNYIRTGGSKEELKAAEYIKAVCEGLGVKAYIDDFPVQMAEIKKAVLTADGREIPCKAYKNSGNASLEAEFMYMPNLDEVSLMNAKGKIVMIDSGVNFVYEKLYNAGIAGFITYNGDVNFRDNDIDQKELRAYVANGHIVPAMNINAKDAFKLVKADTKTVRFETEQDEWMGNSRNVIAEIPGEKDEWITFSAHYDSTPLSVGAYDNLTGTITLIGIMEEMVKRRHNYSLRFVFCGSEERGLLGSKAYVAAHPDEIAKTVLNINVDMIGSVMGKFQACISAEMKLADYVSYMAAEMGFAINARQGVQSSDISSFAYAGVPAVSFQRRATPNQAPIHNRYDTMKVLSAAQIIKDVDFITAFSLRMADAVKCPVARVIPENVMADLTAYIELKKHP